jgi:ELWxxDGT repeat protein
MRISVVLFFTMLLKLSFCSAQLELLADLNKNNYGSNPNNFIEVNGVTYFLSKNGICKVEGAENKVTIIDSGDVVGHHSFQYIYRPIKKLLFRNQNNLYYFKSSKQGLQLWTTDGVSVKLLGERVNFLLGYSELYFINDKICYFASEKLFALANNQQTLLGDYPSYNNKFSNFRPISYSNSLYFFSCAATKNKFYVWKSNGSKAGTVKIDSISNSVDQTYSFFYSEQNSKSDTLNGKPFLMMSKALSSSSYENSMYEIGSSSLLNKRVLNVSDVSFNNTSHMRSVGGKVILFLNNSEIWITNGTAVGTLNLRKSFGVISEVNNNIGYLKGNYYFAEMLNGKRTLWKSDGTVNGTVKLSNVAPYYFQETNSEVLFKNNINELWKTDGTEVNTKKIDAYVLPWSSLKDPNFSFFDVFKTSKNTYLWKNYSADFGLELCISNITSVTPTFININKRTKASVSFTKKVKIKDIWYYNGIDNKGSELWRTDGTAAGSYMVKDINIGERGIEIVDMVEFQGKLYFTIFKDNFHEFWVSDGTVNGTQVLKSVATPIRNYNAEIKAGITKLFFGMIGANTSRNVPWVSNGTTSGTVEIPAAGGVFSDNCGSFTVRGDSLIFTDQIKLWSGNASGVSPVFIPTEVQPQFIKKHLSYKSKFYAIAKYSDFATNIRYDVLFESNGKKAGTKIIKKFNDGELTNFNFPIFDIINDKLIFPALSKDSVNIWSLSIPTALTSKIYFLGNVSKIGNAINTSTLNGKLVILSKSNIPQQPKQVWLTDGTKQNFTPVSALNYTNSELLDFIKTDTSIVYSTLDSNKHYQLWETTLLKAPIKLFQGNVFQPNGLDQYEEDYPFGNFVVDFIGGQVLFPLKDNILLFPNKIIVWNYTPNMSYEPYIYAKKKPLGLEITQKNGLIDCENLVLYPNPSGSGIFRLSNNFKITAFKVYDLNGKEISAKLANPEAQSTLDLGGKLIGNYLIKLITPTCNTTRRVYLN